MKLLKRALQQSVYLVFFFLGGEGGILFCGNWKSSFLILWNLEKQGNKLPNLVEAYVNALSLKQKSETFLYIISSLEPLF